jgi:hypothetical protein
LLKDGLKATERYYSVGGGPTVMSNPFSTAMNYLSGHGGSGNGSGGGSRFLGQTVDLGGSRKLKVKKVIAEGEK